MAVYIIKNEEGEEVNRVIASAEFVKTNYPSSHEMVVPAELTEEELLDVLKITEKDWRDRELKATDQAAQTPDWPNRDNILTYREALRDWPATADFPDTRPEL
jgi:cytochrome c